MTEKELQDSHEDELDGRPVTQQQGENVGSLEGEDEEWDNTPPDLDPNYIQYPASSPESDPYTEVGVGYTMEQLPLLAYGVPVYEEEFEHEIYQYPHTDDISGGIDVLSYVVADYDKVELRPHILAMRVGFAPLVKAADFSNARYRINTNYPLKVHYNKFDDEGNISVAIMAWWGFDVDTNPGEPDNISVRVYGENEAHVRKQVAQLSTATIEQRYERTYN